MKVYRTLVIKSMILKLIYLQQQLQMSVINQYPDVKDYDHFLDIPKKGMLDLIENGKWDFNKHGTGLVFKRRFDALEIDMAEGFKDFPDAIDVWRISFFVESRLVKSNPKKYTDFDFHEAIKPIFDELINTGFLEKISIKKIGNYSNYQIKANKFINNI
jgi:hypothetical protein